MSEATVIALELRGTYRDFILKHIGYCLRDGLIQAMKSAVVNPTGTIICPINPYDLDELIGNLSIEVESMDDEAALAGQGKIILEILEGFENQLKI